MMRWRWLTPIFTTISPIIVGALSWCLVSLYNHQLQTNRDLAEKMDKYIEKQYRLQLDLSERITELRFRCCSESDIPNTASIGIKMGDI